MDLDGKRVNIREVDSVSQPIQAPTGKGGHGIHPQLVLARGLLTSAAVSVLANPAGMEQYKKYAAQFDVFAGLNQRIDIGGREVMRLAQKRSSGRFGLVRRNS